MIIKVQSGPPENFILAGACLKVSETRCDVSGNSGYYRVEAAVSPHHRHARDAQPSAQPIDHGPAISSGQPIDSIDHGPTIDPTIGSGPAIGEAGARGLGPAGARAGHRPQGPRARHAAAGGDPAPGIIVISLISRGDPSSHRNRPTAASKPDEAQPSLVCWLQWAC